MKDLTPRQVAHLLAVAALVVAVFVDVQEQRWGLAVAAILLFALGEGIDATGQQPA